MTDIVQYPDPFLNVPVPELHIDEFGGLPHVHQTLKEAMDEYGAVGIAANQLGQNVRACLVGDKFLVNPTIIDQRGSITYGLEGCLSIDYGNKGYVRPAIEEVVVDYQDMDGNFCAVKFHDFEARVAQHEIRHLNGKLINEGKENE
jgi:peptide deformylase